MVSSPNEINDSKLTNDSSFRKICNIGSQYEIQRRVILKLPLPNPKSMRQSRQTYILRNQVYLSIRFNV